MGHRDSCSFLDNETVLSLCELGPSYGFIFTLLFSYLPIFSIFFALSACQLSLFWIQALLAQKFYLRSLSLSFLNYSWGIILMSVDSISSTWQLLTINCSSAPTHSLPLSGLIGKQIQEVILRHTQHLQASLKVPPQWILEVFLFSLFPSLPVHYNKTCYL